MSKSTGPEILLFKNFKANWTNIDKTVYKTGIEDPLIARTIKDQIEDVSNFISKILNSEVQPRDDYKELLLLSLIFIGKLPEERVKFYKPGGVSRARWMARAIYCLKIFLFRDQISLSKNEESAIRQICIFIVLIYIKAWFTATHAPSAPNNDLTLIKTLHAYKAVNSKIALVALKKLSNHLWYLAPETAALAFFDENVSVEIKEKMVQNIRSEDFDFDESDRIANRFTVPQQNYSAILNEDVDYFISPQSMAFFKRFEIKCTFFDKKVSEWHLDENYQIGLKIVKKLKVVNDIAERGIKIITEYNKRLSTNEEQKQCVLQVVEKYNKLYNSATKEKLATPMKLE